MAYMFKSYDETEAEEAPKERRKTVAPEGGGLGGATPITPELRGVRRGAAAILVGSVVLCFPAPPVGAFGIVASLVVLVFCAVAAQGQDQISREARAGHAGCAWLWWLLLVMVAIITFAVAIGGGMVVGGMVKGL